MVARFSNLKTTNPINTAAPSRRKVVGPAPRKCLNRGEATRPLPNPIPRINAIRTKAKTCNDAPKIRHNEREANTSNPIETAPVRATIRQPQWRMAEAVAGWPGGGGGSFAIGTAAGGGAGRVLSIAMAMHPMTTLTNAL